MKLPQSKIAVLISGGGSNLQALIDATTNGALDAEIALVVSNKKQAYGLVRAEKAGIPTHYFPRTPFRGLPAWREQFDEALAAVIAPYQPDLIVLAGWMHINTAAFLDQFPGRVINLHPALPGQFPGAHAIDEAWAAFQSGDITQTGCMVHYATPQLDAGPVLVSAVVPMHPTDTQATFESRLHAIEHRAIVLATHIALQNIT